MIEQPSRFTDPKTQLLQWIVDQDKLITEHMFNGEDEKALHQIVLLLGQVDLDADKQLAPHMHQLKKDLRLDNYSYYHKLYYAFDLVHEFLRKTYYKGCWWTATPKESRPAGKL